MILHTGRLQLKTYHQRAHWICVPSKTYGHWPYIYDTAPVGCLNLAQGDVM
jgi:hypothetical protein